MGIGSRARLHKRRQMFICVGVAVNLDLEQEVGIDLGEIGSSEGFSTLVTL